MKTLFVILISTLLLGCGTTAKITSSQPTSVLNGKKIHLQLPTSSGAMSISGAAMNSESSVVAGGSAMSGEDQAEIAAQNLVFELRSLGLRLTNTVDDSDVLANFSIGTIRYDPITGWIADQAFLEFIDKNGDHILTVRAKTKFVTPTVDNMIKKLIKELENSL